MHRKLDMEKIKLNTDNMTTEDSLSDIIPLFSDQEITEILRDGNKDTFEMPDKTKEE